MKQYDEHNLGTLATTNAPAIAELLFLNAAMGKGYTLSSEFERPTGLIAMSGLSYQLRDEFAEAEQEFRVQRAIPGKPLPMGTTSSDPYVRHKSLRRQLATTPYDALSYVDSCYRVWGYLRSPSRLLRDLRFLYLGGEAHYVPARVRARGLASTDPQYEPEFQWFIMVHDDQLEPFAKLIRTKRFLWLAREATLRIDGLSSTTVPIFHHEILACMNRIFVRGGLPADQRVAVGYEDEEAEAAWRAFFLTPDDHWLHHIGVSEKMWEQRTTCTLRNIKAFAARAAVTSALFRNLSILPTSPEAPVKVALTVGDAAFVCEASIVLAGEQLGAAFRLRSERPKKSLWGASGYTTKDIDRAITVLTDAIKNSPTGKVSRTVAARLSCVTAGLLDRVIERDPQFVVLHGTENIRMGKTKVAYALAETAPTPPDASTTII